MYRPWLAWVLLLVSWGMSTPTFAQAPSLELNFTPVDRAQIAVWVEQADGTFMGTLALTYGVAKAGIGNRPGALQMNSGFRWPYGRREGALPVWAHRRAHAPNAKQWKRVIFQDRGSEGFASRTSNDQSADNYYCLSFQRESSGRDALDAVTCASVFSSDKGRYVTQQDVDDGYAEPFETSAGQGSMRKLDASSLYPPRRDIERCTASGCFDHADVDDYRKHALEVMPELDAVTRATLQGRRPAQWTFSLPAEWPKDKRYKLYIEVNVEGDYNADYDPTRFPTPQTPAASWDSWAREFGYAYRGQPSVVYALDFELGGADAATTFEPEGYGSLHGESDALEPMDKNISDDPLTQMGSGADRLLANAGARANLRVVMPDSPYCQQTKVPAAVTGLKVTPHPDKLHAHMWARMTFEAPVSQRTVGSYVVEVKADGADWEQAYTPDSDQELLPVALDVCADPDDPTVNRCLQMQSGTEIDVVLSGLRPATHYEVRVTPRDRDCGQLGEVAASDVTTRARTFSTVSPCFVATAAYGTPLADEIFVLRAFRDRYLLTNPLGRAFVAAYYAAGPTLAAPVREHPWLASAVRSVLDPVVSTVAWWMR